MLHSWYTRLASVMTKVRLACGAVACSQTRFSLLDFLDLARICSPQQANERLHSVYSRTKPDVQL